MRRRRAARAITSGLLATGLAIGTVACGGLDTSELETEIAAELAADGLEDPTVSCPEDVQVEEGGTFDCQLTVADSSHAIEARQLDDEGNVEWELASIIVDSAGIADSIASEIEAETQTPFAVDCSAEGRPDVFLGDDGDQLSCEATDAETDEVYAINVMLDLSEPDFATWELVDDA